MIAAAKPPASAPRSSSSCAEVYSRISTSASSIGTSSSGPTARLATSIAASDQARIFRQSSSGQPSSRQIIRTE